MMRVVLATGNILASLVLGALLLAFIGVNFPETLSGLIGWARQLKIAITSSALPARYNIWLELLLEERQLLFMFFTVAARIVMAAFWSVLMWSIGGRRTENG